MNQHLTYSRAGLELTEHFEGCRLQAYADQVGVWTIGYGHTHGVAPGMACDQRLAEAWLLEDVQEAVDAVQRLVLVRLTQNQFDALVDFVFNLGSGNLAHSTLLHLLNAGDYAGASHHFREWDRAGGIVRSGLLRRRIAEEALFDQE